MRFDYDGGTTCNEFNGKRILDYVIKANTKMVQLGMVPINDTNDKVENIDKFGYLQKEFAWWCVS